MSLRPATTTFCDSLLVISRPSSYGSALSGSWLVRGSWLICSTVTLIGIILARPTKFLMGQLVVDEVELTIAVLALVCCIATVRRHALHNTVLILIEEDLY